MNKKWKIAFFISLAINVLLIGYLGNRFYERYLLHKEYIITLEQEKDEKKFNKAKWLQVDDIRQYTYREAMLTDLTNNYKLKGLSYNQLVDLIGEPQKNLIGDSNQILYPITEDYGLDIDPVYTVTLVFTLDKDSMVNDFKINEWNK